MNKHFERVQQVQTLVSYGFYPYLNLAPFSERISSNFKVYPNEFLGALINSLLAYGQEFETMLLMDENYSTIYQMFKKQYQECYKQYLKNYEAEQQQLMMQQYQQQQMYMQQQAQYGGQYGQNTNGITYSGQQGDSYATQQNAHNYQNRRQNNNYNNNNPQEGYRQQNNYHQKRNYHQEGHNNQGAYNSQAGYSNNQGSYNNQGGYNNNQGSYNNQGGYSNNQGSYNNQRDGQNRRNNQKGQSYNQNSHGNRYHQKNPNNAQNDQPQSQVAQVQQEVKRPRTPSPPPKPESKPMKFSMKEIRSFVEQFKAEDNGLVNPELIEKVKEANSWKKDEISFVEKQEKNQAPNKMEKKHSTRDNNQGGSYNQQNPGFKKGANYKPSVEEELKKKPSGLVIKTGVNETLETKLIKNEIKSKEGKDFASVMSQQYTSLDEVAKAKKEIIYNLNLLAPENIREIREDLQPFLGQSSDTCEVLVEQIIEKAWAQPKYASTYAKLSSDFSKAPSSEFKFDFKSDKKDSNPFKLFLISNVQHSFDKKAETFPEFKDNEEKEAFFKATKKKILGNVKFIAELIRSKVLKKRIMKICISQLILTFLTKYHDFRKTQKIEDSHFDYYFEAVIEFIENVGDYYEKMEEAGKSASLPAAQKVVNDLIDIQVPPPEDEIKELVDLSANDYFAIFEIIDEKVLKKVNRRLSALLLNLEERRANKWEKHLAEAEGPKKLKDIKEDIVKEEQDMNTVKVQKKANLERLNDLVKTLFKDWEKDAKTEKQQMKTILREYSRCEFYSSFLNQVADEKKDKVKKRVELFELILEQYFNSKDFQESWLETVRGLAFSASDFPYCGSALALILCMIRETKDGLKLSNYYLKTDDEDEEFFMNEVYAKFYHYTQWEDIKKFCQPSKKVHNMLEKSEKSQE